MKTHTHFAKYGGLLLPLLLIQTGCQNVLGFSTATKFGLDISQRSDQMIDVTLGYDRTEVASIPVPKDQDASGTLSGQCNTGSACSDTYSVLGTFEVNYDNPFLMKPLEINQFFATGMAARVAARKAKFQEILGAKAGKYATETIQASEQQSLNKEKTGGGQ